MSINLDKVWDRYETALEARPAKGPWTPENTSALADSCADVPVLVRELEALREATKAVEASQKMGRAIGATAESVASSLVTLGTLELARENRRLKALVRALRGGN